MLVRVAQREDYCAWLDLAAEVEPLFGPMVDDPVFRRALSRNLARGSAYCIREHDGPAGSRLIAGLLLSVHPPVHRIGWLAVARSYRRSGFGTALVEHMIRQTPPSAELLVITFGSGVRGGEPARRFYERMGFIPAETVEPGPGGTPRQVFRRPVETASADARSETFAEQPASGS